MISKKYINKYLSMKKTAVFSVYFEGYTKSLYRITYTESLKIYTVTCEMISFLATRVLR